MTDDELDAIEERLTTSLGLCYIMRPAPRENPAYDDMTALIAEVRRLRSAMRETFVQGAIYERARTTACGPQPANGYLANLARCEAFRRWPDGEVNHD